MPIIKFIDARFFEGNVSTIDERLSEFLKQFRARKITRELGAAGTGKLVPDPFDLDTFGDGVMTGVRLTTPESKRIRHRAKRLVERRNALSNLAHPKTDEIKQLSVLKNGAMLTPPGSEAWADELAAALHAKMP
jgi:hypothetical protein